MTHSCLFRIKSGSKRAPCGAKGKGKGVRGVPLTLPGKRAQGRTLAARRPRGNVFPAGNLSLIPWAESSVARAQRTRPAYCRLTLPRSLSREVNIMTCFLPAMTAGFFVPAPPAGGRSGNERARPCGRQRSRSRASVTGKRHAAAAASKGTALERERHPPQGSQRARSGARQRRAAERQRA